MSLNCSVYSLTQGYLDYQDYFTQEWYNNTERFLPAYYITNCLVPDVLAQIRTQNVSDEEVTRWMDEYRNNPYNITDNGDLFVALLFTFLGLCVLCWMLMLLYLLLPPHKRKPWPTLLCTLVYLIVLTVILVQITRATEAEYYKDLLNTVKIMCVLGQNHYIYALIVAHFLICVAYIQLLWKMTKASWRWHSTVFALILILVGLVTSICSAAVAPATLGYNRTVVDDALAASIAMGIIFTAWFSYCLAYHTFRAKPRLVAYTHRLLPLAIFTWLVIIGRQALCILLLTYWNEQWLVNSWLSYLPNVIDIYVLAAGWEWLYLIEQVEQKLELSGMLGRRISIDDVMNFSNEWTRGLAGRKYPLMMAWMTDKVTKFKNRRKNQNENPREPDHNSSEINVELGDLTPLASNDDLVVNMDEQSVCEIHHDGGLWSSDSDLDMQSDTQNTTTEVRDDSELVQGTSSAHENSVSNTAPPPFVPHPGLSIDDYWDEKR